MINEFTIEQKIEQLATKYSSALKQKINERVELMKEDDNSHYLIYRVLGITDDEGALIDVYQNKGRFLYKYAGSFLEEATLVCFKEKYPDVKIKQKIPNKIGQRPVNFEMDCLLGSEAYEIKWKDATTDGDHITKEHTRLRNIKEAGFTPIRIMYYYPEREQAKRIQQTLKTLYLGMDGKYYFGDDAWNFVKEKTEVDLKEILTKIADKVSKI
jgi:hypothetical protein